MIPTADDVLTNETFYAGTLDEFKMRRVRSK
jgi:hypothetical protein